MNRRSLQTLALTFLYVLLFSGCGGSPPPETAPVSSTSSEAAGPEIGIVSGINATVLGDVINNTFQDNMSKFYGCYEEALEDLEDIEGTVNFVIQVGDGDRVVQAYIDQSDLGSIEAERCMLRKVGFLTFERQGDGVATITKEIILEAPYDHGRPGSFDEATVDKIVEENISDVERCVGGKSGIHLTAYVGKGGMVLSSGAAVDQYELLDSASCIAKAVRKWQFPNPGPDLAKVYVTF